MSIPCFIHSEFDECVCERSALHLRVVVVENERPALLNLGAGYFAEHLRQVDAGQCRNCGRQLADQAGHVAGALVAAANQDDLLGLGQGGGDFGGNLHTNRQKWAF